MKNFERLVKVEAERELDKELYGLDDSDMVDYDVRVEHIPSKRQGIADVYGDGEKIMFTVPSEDLKEYLYTIEEFNSEFKILD